MSYIIDERLRGRRWPSQGFVALGPGRRVVAFARSERRAKERAIALGILTPLVVPASRVRVHATRD